MGCFAIELFLSQAFFKKMFNVKDLVIGAPDGLDTNVARREALLQIFKLLQL